MKLIFFLLLATYYSFSQNNIEINKKAPSIKITNWIENIPKNKSLDNKFLILDFWATWCSPCLRAMPHLNELKNEYKNEDILFISITDEEQNKVEKILNIIKFNTIVVSDTTKQTQINFGDGKQGITELPLTVLIDKDKIIRWFGRPKDLNKKVLDSFLKGNNIINEKANLNQNHLKLESDFNNFIEISKDSLIKYYFQITKSKINTENVENGKVNKSLFYLNSSSLEEILLNVLDYNKNTFDLDNISNEKYDLIYKNRSFKPSDIHQIENVILNSLGIKKLKLKKNINSYKTTIDKNIISLSNSKKTSISYHQNKVFLFSYNLEMLCDFLNKNTDKHFHVNLKSSDKFDIIIDFNDIENILLNLKKQGFMTREEKLKIDFYTFKKEKSSANSGYK